MNTDYLFARPSLRSGIARLFDFWGLYDEYDFSRPPKRSDAQAMALDWQAVGQDLAEAIKQVDLEGYDRASRR